MSGVSRPLIFWLLGLTLLGAAPASTPDPAAVAIRAMHWSNGPQRLSASQSNIVPPSQVFMIRGDEAQKYDKLVNGEADEDTEGIAQDAKTGDVVYFEYKDAGYVTVDDWTKVDPSGMLQSIKDGTDAGNEDRKSNGLAALHVLDWVQKPTYDSSSKTVRWAISAKADDSPVPIVNSIALILGRHGYEKLTWVTQQSSYVSRGGMLDHMVVAQHFNQGARYQDYVSGDKLAGYGIAALVGTVAGATLVKTGAFVAILLALKKLWFLVIAGLVGAWRWVSQRMKGTQLGPPPSVPS
jgi:uncharacterized membrane-anchored protein